MIPLIPIYYVALVVFTVLFAKYNPIISLPDAIDKVSGYIEAGKEQLQQKFPEISSKPTPKCALIQKCPCLVKLYQNDKVQAVLTWISDKRSTYVEPYLEKIGEFIDPYVKKFTKFVTPYLGILISKLLPIYHKVLKWYTKYSQKFILAFQPQISVVAKQYHWLVSQYKQSIGAVKSYYETKVEPILVKNHDYAILVAYGVIIAIAIPVILFILKKIMTAVTKDAYTLGQGVNTMYSVEETSEVVTVEKGGEGSSSKETTPLPNPSCRSRKESTVVEEAQPSSEERKEIKKELRKGHVNHHPTGISMIALAAATAATGKGKKKGIQPVSSKYANPSVGIVEEEVTTESSVSENSSTFEATFSSEKRYVAHK